MTKLTWNESQKYLMTQWGEARAMELAMGDIRKSYEAFLERVALGIKKRLPVFDRPLAYTKPSWGPGGIGMSPKRWPTNEQEGHSGFWLEHLRLEYLCNDEEVGTNAYLWISERTPFDHSSCRTAIQRSSVFKKHEKDAALNARLGEETILIEINAPTKSELRNLVLKNDESGFLERCVTLFEEFAKYVSIVDEWLPKTAKVPR